MARGARFPSAGPEGCGPALPGSAAGPPCARAPGIVLRRRRLRPAAPGPARTSPSRNLSRLQSLARLSLRPLRPPPAQLRGPASGRPEPGSLYSRSASAAPRCLSAPALARLGSEVSARKSRPRGAGASGSRVYPRERPGVGVGAAGWLSPVTWRAGQPQGPAPRRGARIIYFTELEPRARIGSKRFTYGNSGTRPCIASLLPCGFTRALQRRKRLESGGAHCRGQEDPTFSWHLCFPPPGGKPVPGALPGCCPWETPSRPPLGPHPPSALITKYSPAL